MLKLMDVVFLVGSIGVSVALIEHQGLTCIKPFRSIIWGGGMYCITIAFNCVSKWKTWRREGLRT